MSSGDYTALRKIKQFQNNYNLSAGTGPTGPTGPTGSIGPEGPVGPSNGGMFTIIAESNSGFDTIMNDGFSYSFGAGAKHKTANYGVQIGVACELNYIGVQVAEVPSTLGIIQIWKNSIYSNISINNISTSSSKSNVKLELNPGDFINIKNVYGNGGGSVIVSLWFSTAGVVGPVGPVGPCGISKIGNSSGMKLFLDTNSVTAVSENTTGRLLLEPSINNNQTSLTLTYSSQNDNTNRLLGSFYCPANTLTGAIVPGLWELNIYAKTIRELIDGEPIYIYMHISVTDKTDTDYYIIGSGVSSPTRIEIADTPQLYTHTISVNGYILPNQHICIDLYGLRKGDEEVNGQNDQLVLYFRNPTHSHIITTGGNYMDLVSNQKITGDKIFTGNVHFTGNITCDRISELESTVYELQSQVLELVTQLKGGKNN